MKKSFTILAIAAISAQFSAQVLSQNATPNVVSASGSVACGNAASGYTADNSYYRVFKLSDYAINYDYQITNVAFGVQTANTALPVEVSVSTYSGTFPNGTESLLGTSVVNVLPANVGTMVSTGTALTQTVPNGGTFLVKLFHDGSTASPVQSFYLGTNPGAQTAPSYLSSETCGIVTPIATGTGALAGFATARWVITVTGRNAQLGVTEVINSQNLQILQNPVKDVLKFKFNNALKAEKVELYDMNGRSVTAVTGKDLNEVNVVRFPKGAYVVRITATDGQVYIQKVIKN